MSIEAEVAANRAEQGLPPTVVDPDALAKVGAALSRRVRKSA